MPNVVLRSFYHHKPLRLRHIGSRMTWSKSFPRPTSLELNPSVTTSCEFQSNRTITLASERIISFQKVRCYIVMGGIIYKDTPNARLQFSLGLDLVQPRLTIAMFFKDKASKGGMIQIIQPFAFTR